MTRLASQNSAGSKAAAKPGQPAATNGAVDRAILMVTGGALSGARMNLDVGRTYSVGSDEHSDIVLRGSNQGGSTMQLTLSSKNISVSGSNRPAVDEVDYHDELSFGTSRFFVVKSDELIKPSIVSSSDPVATERIDYMVDVESANANDAEPSTDHLLGRTGSAESNDYTTSSLAQNGFRRWLRPLLYATAIALAGLIALGVYVWQGDTFSKPVAEVVPIDSHLAEAGFEYLQVDRSSATPIISGYVQSRAQAMELDKVIAGQSEGVINRVQVDAEIKDQIENVLRVNGVAGSVDSLGNGAFVANTNLPLGGQLAALQGMIERDVPLVASFTVNNQIPDAPFVEPNDEAVELDSGKRVVLVNSDDPAYVVTEDQSRYFIGSILPGGYRITDILDGRVLLEKQGKTTELKF